MAYSPGVAEPCRKIHANPEDVFKYTAKGNLVAVVSDGPAVLGLGDIGPLAAMPVMEGKAILFKEFAGVDAFPICLDTKDTEEIIETVKRLAPTFGGINLEDISAPRCFNRSAQILQPKASVYTTRRLHPTQAGRCQKSQFQTPCRSTSTALCVQS